MSAVHSERDPQSSESVTPPPLFQRLPGEQDFLAVSLSGGTDGVALSYPVDEDGVPIRCGVYITNYRTIIIPKRGSDIFIPHNMLDSWELERHTMNATQRAAFPQTLSHAPGGNAPSMSASPTAYTLTMVTKYLWNFKIMFQDERQASSARKLIDSLRPAHLKDMPAFEMYRSAGESKGATADGTIASPRSSQGAASTAPAAVVSLPPVNYGWSIFNCAQEMNRQLCPDPSQPCPSLVDDESKCGPGLDLRNWFRTTNMAQEDNMYGRSPTYPFYIVEPNSISDPMLVDCIYARSRGRIPAISFVHLGTGAVLARCSQPLSKGDLRKDGDLCNALVNAGYSLKNVRPREVRTVDPMANVAIAGRSVAPPPSLIDSNFSSPAPSSPLAPPSGPASSAKRMRTLLVADCRPYAAAYGNQTMGGGFESGPSHDFCKVKFHGIDNIHGITKAFQKLKSMVHSFNGKTPKESFYDQLHDSQWLYHVQRVLMCSSEIAESLDRGDSCLVHCTDGWDRTSQCTSIAMLLLDPFYRTTLGFCILIEKEFCAFGHKFAERNSHMAPGDTYYHSESGVSSSDTESHQVQTAHKLQPSPIFVHWIDCIFQILRQFPNSFEFTTKLLEFLAEEAYSCLYGTFLTNSDKERTFEGVKLRTVSLWTRILDIVSQEKRGAAPPYFLNTFYNAKEAWRFISKKENSGVQFLPISCSSKRIVFWEDHYLRYDSDHLSIRLLDHSANQRLDEHRRSNEPYYCKELEDYLNAAIQKAVGDRQQDVVYMTELLSRLQVQRQPPVAETKQASAKTVITTDAKSCWKCHEKFGFFGSKEYCSSCVNKVPLCSRCIQTKNGKKFCSACIHVVEEDE